jgi:glycosyltransferase involved in cell wall biosynthesis
LSGRPLRIAVFSDSALPILNGVSVSIDALIRELRDAGHSVHLFTSAHFKYRDKDPNTHRFLALETPWWKGYPLSVPPFYPLLHEFRKVDFDIVHTHTPFTVGMIGLRWAESHELPVVSTYHTLYDKYAHYVRVLPHRYVRFKIAKHTNFYYNRVHHVITPSEPSRRWLRRHAVKTPIEVIPTGVRLPSFINRPESREKLGARPEHKILLYVGRVAREKNLGLILKSAALTFQEDEALRLWVVGDGPMQQECREIARNLGIGDRVSFFGFVPRDELGPYYAAADLFVFGSFTETQGLVVIEAMMHGLPALVVRGGGAAMAIRHGENGFTLPNDANIFAAKIKEVLADEALYAKLAEGATRSARSYSTKAMMEQVLDVYGRVLAAPQEGQERAYVPSR